MAKGRKTIEVEKLKRWVNGRLDSPMTSVDGRWELARLLERVLHETDNYKGFGYLDSEYAAGDQARHRFPNGETGVLRDGYDETRRSYR